MGGLDYEWGKNGETYNCSAATLPMAAYTEIYVSDDGESIMNVTTVYEWYLLAAGFLHWEGYSIHNDPAFGFYTSALETLPDDGVFPLVELIIFSLIVILATTVIVISVIFIKRFRRNHQ